MQTHRDTLCSLFPPRVKFKVNWTDRNAPVSKRLGVSIQTGSAIIV